tara:strand:+ start:47681 stop:48214 length:534 start_codon:yes stop_codon:yes gene_type:complete
MPKIPIATIRCLVVAELSENPYACLFPRRVLQGQQQRDLALHNFLFEKIETSTNPRYALNLARYYMKGVLLKHEPEKDTPSPLLCQRGASWMILPLPNAAINALHLAGKKSIQDIHLRENRRILAQTHGELLNIIKGKSLLTNHCGCIDVGQTKKEIIEQAKAVQKELRKVERREKK